MCDAVGRLLRYDAAIPTSKLMLLRILKQDRAGFVRGGSGSGPGFQAFSATTSDLWLIQHWIGKPSAAMEAKSNGARKT